LQQYTLANSIGYALQSILNICSPLKGAKCQLKNERTGFDCKGTMAYLLYICSAQCIFHKEVKTVVPKKEIFPLVETTMAVVLQI